MLRSKFYRNLSVILLFAGLLWIALAKLVFPAIVRFLYVHPDLPLVGNFMPGRNVNEVESYLNVLQQNTYVPQVMVFLGLLWILSIIISNPIFHRRFVKEAPAESLAIIRIITCFILIISAAWEDPASSALLPRYFINPLGMTKWLYKIPIGFEQFVADPFALGVFKWLTITILILGLVGWKTKYVIPLGAICYFVIGGVLRQYTHFFHTGIVPLYVITILAFTPCADAYSLDKNNKKHKVSNNSVYGWSRYAVWSGIALTYTMAGFSKLRNGGLMWWESSNFRNIIYSDSLNHMEFNWKVSLQLTEVPDVFISVLGLIGLLGEATFILVLFSRTARWILPFVMILMHVGIFFLQNVLFFDLIILLSIFFVCNYFESKNKFNSELISSNNIDFKFYKPPLAVSSLITILIFCWTYQIEYFPFTAMQMYSEKDTSRIITYHRAVAHYDNGDVTRAYPEQAIGAMRDSRFRRFLRNCFSEDSKYCVDFFKTCGKISNSSTLENRNILKYEIQEWKWDYGKFPKDIHYGNIVGRYFVEI